MGFRVLGTNHTSFTVSSLDRSVGFFRDCLGFDLVSRAPRDPAIVQRITGVDGADMEIAFLRGPGHTVELIEYKAPAAKGRVEARPCDTGFAHLALNVDDLDRVAAEMKSTGAEFVLPTNSPEPGVRYAFIKTPEGVLMELTEDKSVKPGS